MAYQPPVVQGPLPPALQHLRNLILHKYMENIIIQQESPMDLSISSIKTDRDCSGSTGSQSPRSDHSLDISHKSTDDDEDEYLEVDVVDEEEEKTMKSLKMKKPKYQ